MKYIILYCPRDHVWIVARQTGRRDYVYITVAECFTEEAAELLYKELTNKR